MRLDGKVALITDIAGETGGEIARRFVAEGATVYGSRGAGVREGKGELPTGVTRLEGDPRVPADTAAMMEAIEQKSARLDIIVQHGVGGRMVGTILDVTQESFLESITGDVWSVICLSSAAIPLMRKGGGGSIINIASIGYQGLHKRPIRGASQSSVVGLTRSMAADHAEDQIRVNALLVGPIDVPGSSREQVAQLAKGAPLGRLTKPEDVANTALFLASDESSLMTGALIVLDAGRSLPT